MGMTLAQKILARTSGRAAVDVGEVIMVEPDVFELIDLVLPHYFKTLASHGVTRLRYPERCVVFADHEVPSQSVRVAALKKALKTQMRDYGIQHIYDEGRHGISHQAIVEYGHILPGMLVLSADTHATTLGCVGALAPPINYETIQALATGEIWMRVPETIRVTLHGRPRPGVMSRDIAQQIGAMLGTETCDYRVIEYAGPALSALDMDARMTLCNVAVDMGAKAAVVEADAITERYLRGRTTRPCERVVSDPDAKYSHRVDIDLAELEPMIAAPPSPDNLVQISSLAGVHVDQVYIGSCAGGRLEDLRAAAQVVRGRRVHRDVRMIVVPTSQEIYADAASEGLLEIFARAGATVMAPSCGPCYGNLAPLADGDVCIGTGTTNMPGRMGSAKASIYLANAAVAAASAVAGRITAPDTLDMNSTTQGGVQ
jgi:3-isopropylmalate/(R)-2-methylmalate dehydratase large subunit